MEPAFINHTDVGNGVNGNIVNADFDFKPGFRLGIGGYFDHDNWDMRLGYTWFHCTEHSHASAGSDSQVYPMIGRPWYFEDLYYESVSQSWNLKMDILQLDLGRWHYVGTKLTTHPYVGARAAWIRQKLELGYDVSSNDGLDDHLNFKTNSWALGPEVGIDSNWIIGSGFRFFANAEADLLFTRYTKASESDVWEDHEDIPFKLSQKSINSLRTHLDLDFGFGWGTYLDCNNWYLDFALGYEFQVFFDQNMFRHHTDDLMIGNSNMPNGNLYINGLHFTAKLDF